MKVRVPTQARKKNATGRWKTARATHKLRAEYCIGAPETLPILAQILARVPALGMENRHEKPEGVSVLRFSFIISGSRAACAGAASCQALPGSGTGRQGRPGIPAVTTATAGRRLRHPCQALRAPGGSCTRTGCRRPTFRTTRKNLSCTRPGSPRIP